MTTSCTSPHSVEFLGFEGCPNTPELRLRLVESAPDIEIIDVDLMSLKPGDLRLRWGAPTILVDGKGLFGMPPNNDAGVSCRNWEDGLPTPQQIQYALEN